MGRQPPRKADPIEPGEWSEPAEYQEDCHLIVSITIKAPKKMSEECRKEAKADDKGFGLTEAHTIFGCTNSLLGIIKVPSKDVVDNVHIDYTYLLGHEVRHTVDRHCSKEK